MQNKKTVELRKRAAEMALAGREILDPYTDAELAAIYKGIGPDAFPGWLRDLVTSLHPTLEVVALIHDVEWHASDKTRNSFIASNGRFQKNGYKAAKAAFGWYDPRRYMVMNQARRFGNLCELFGWRAWCSPCECAICKGA